MKLPHVFHMFDFLFVFHGFVVFFGENLSDFLVYNICIISVCFNKSNLTNSVVHTDTVLTLSRVANTYSSFLHSITFRAEHAYMNRHPSPSIGVLAAALALYDCKDFIV